MQIRYGRFDGLLGRQSNKRDMENKPEASYFVPTTSKTLDILESFHTVGEELTLEEIISRAKVPRTTAFRILYTLEQRRYVTRRGKRYRLNSTRKKIRVGFGSLTSELAFAQVVTASLTEAAAAAGIDLFVIDNHRDPQAAIQNARRMVAENVDVAIEFQRHVDVSPVIADIFGTAGIPLIAVHIPHPGAIYFGVDNYKSGYAAGAALAEFAQTHWEGHVDLVVLLDIPEGGIVLQSRMTGALRSMEATLGPLPRERVLRVGGGGERALARSAMATILATHPDARHILVSACSDDGALGAMDEVLAANRSRDAAIVGMEGSAEALAMVAKADSPFIGSVAFYPEQYGPALVDLVLRLVNGEQVPPFRYVNHELIGREKAAQTLASAGG